MFPYKIFKIFQNSYFTEDLRADRLLQIFKYLVAWLSHDIFVKQDEANVLLQEEKVQNTSSALKKIAQLQTQQLTVGNDSF